MGCGTSTSVARQTQPVTGTNQSNKQDSGSEGYVSDDSNPDTPQPHIIEMPEPEAKHKPVLRTASTIQAENVQKLSRKHPELKIVLKSFDHTIAILRQRAKWKEHTNETYFEEVQNTMKKNLLDNFQKFSDEEERLVMGNHLVDQGFPKLLFEFYEHVFEDADIQAFDNKLAHEAEEDETLIILMTIRDIFWNFSDSCPAFSKAVAETGIFNYLIDDLSAIEEDGLEVLEIYEKYIRNVAQNSTDRFPDNRVLEGLSVFDLQNLNKDDLTDQEWVQNDKLEADSDPFAFISAVEIFHNCAHNWDTERTIYRDVKAVDSLLPFLESKQPKIQMVTLLALADMIDDNECDKIHGSENVFKFLRDMIKEARKAKDRRKEGFCVSELIDGLLGLAKAEKNKTLIMDTKPLGIFRKVLEDKHVKELVSVCCIVRELAFNQSNIGKIKEEKELCRKLAELQKDGNEDIRISARGAIFQLELEDSKPPVGPRSGLPPIPDEETPKTGTDDHPGITPAPRRLSRGQLPWVGQHIMISYNWDNQKEILKIKDHLVDKEYNVWLDLEHMHTYMLDAMAQAVENAFVILVCFSEKYKFSQNCRAEAEYAFHKQKEIIPLKMQNGYNPDGWLGILLGPKLYYEFTERFNFEEKVKEMLNAIDKLPNNPKYIPVDVPAQIRHPRPSRKLTPQSLHIVPETDEFKIPDFVKWTRDQVNQWLRKSGLDPTRQNKLQNLTAEQLVFLKKVSTKAPEFFFRCLENKLGLDSLEDIMKLSNALELLVV